MKQALTRINKVVNDGKIVGDKSNIFGRGISINALIKEDKDNGQN